jgi:hypothetical protein
LKKLLSIESKISLSADFRRWTPIPIPFLVFKTKHAFKICVYLRKSADNHHGWFLFPD